MNRQPELLFLSSPIRSGSSCSTLQLQSGGIPTPLKNMSSSVGMIIPNIWKIKAMFQTTHQLHMFVFHVKFPECTYTQNLLVTYHFLTFADFTGPRMKNPCGFMKNGGSPSYHGYTKIVIHDLDDFA